MIQLVVPEAFYGNVSVAVHKPLAAPDRLLFDEFNTGIYTIISFSVCDFKSLLAC